jgi:hypothetical protein
VPEIFSALLKQQFSPIGANLVNARLGFGEPAFTW